jgi:hypothetical protein
MIVDRAEIATLPAPYRRIVRLETIRFESGMDMLRVVIREGHRITQIDLDAATAAHWAALMAEWAAAQPTDRQTAPD